MSNNIPKRLLVGESTKSFGPKPSTSQLPDKGWSSGHIPPRDPKQPSPKGVG